ncbi:hypothetical protein HU200_053511 [Digitaria exilis]|uniref:Jacalin-type lectin domain-containing protein n=1 Tax=Digitaria exilis TaxID=1010633 RepID=A0A835AM05_9POAL|nr:hypothetical protein HU200_053511 [Digitaria exilis]
MAGEIEFVLFTFPLEIEFAPTEYVKKFAGSTGNGVVATLVLETNLKTYEIYDKDETITYIPGTNIPIGTSQTTRTVPPFNIPLSEGNVPFSVPVPDNASIVGFYGRAGGSLDAIGTVPVKIGAWGGDSGKTFNVTDPPKRHESVTICAGDIVDSFGYSYVDQAGKKHTVGPCGGTGGRLATIQFAQTEYVKKFSGTIGSRGQWVVASLEIETNLQTYGPYGKETHNHFSIPIPENAGVVGFFGRAEGNLNAIGVYISNSKFIFADATQENSTNHATTSPQPLIITKEAGPIKIGTWGGDGGEDFDVTEAPKRLESVTIRAGYVVDAIGFSYIDQLGKKHTVGPCGGNGGNDTTSQLAPSEYVKNFYGTIGDFEGNWVVASLTIETNIETYGTYGTDQSTHFSIPLPKDASIVGFFGRAGALLDAIGVYPPSEHRSQAAEDMPHAGQDPQRGGGGQRAADHQPGNLQWLSELIDGEHQGRYLLDMIGNGSGGDRNELEHKDYCSDKVLPLPRASSISPFNPAKRMRVAARSAMKRALSICDLGADEIDRVLESLQGVSADLGEFIMLLQGYQQISRPLPTNIFVDGQMFGRHVEKERIINFLLHTDDRSSKKLGVLPIVGAIGVGKTTLVQHACDDDRVRRHFSAIVFFNFSCTYAIATSGCTAAALRSKHVIGDADQLSWKSSC